MANKWGVIIIDVQGDFTKWKQGSLAVPGTNESYVKSAEAAAQHHFGVGAPYLNRQQASQLAAVLPNPLRWSAGRPDAYVNRRAAWIRQQMTQLGGSHYLNQLKPQRPDWWPRWL